MDDLTSLRWFRRRRVGFGWRPVGWQGWLITLLAVTAAVVVVVVFRGPAVRIPVLVLIVACYAVVALLTGGRRSDDAPPSRDAAESPAVPPGSAGLSGEQRDALRILTAKDGERRGSEGPALVVEHLTKRFGESSRGRRRFVLGCSRRGVRLPRSQRRRQDDDGAHARDPDRADVGLRRHRGRAARTRTGFEIRQRIAVMPENPGLYLRLTVAENLEYFAGLYGLRDPQPRIQHALDAVNLGNRADDLCSSLSKGLRQRVALARALLSDPAILFLDEPTSGLDPVASREVHDLIDGLRSRGVTVFLTTHRLEEAERLCDRVAILNTRLAHDRPPR